MTPEEREQIGRLIDGTAEVLQSKQICGMPRFLALVVASLLNEPKALAGLPEDLRVRAKALLEGR